MDHHVIDGFDVADRGIFSSTTLYDSGKRLGLDIGMHGLHAQSRKKRLVARAYTLKFAPADATKKSALNFYDVIAAAPTGSVLVVEAGIDQWLCGANTTRFAELSGLSGVLMDGCVRDLGAIRDREFPIFARGAAVKGYGGKLAMSAAGGEIACAGVSVSPGDLIVADDDGAVCVPADRLDEILYEAEEIARLDATLEQAIEARQPLAILHETRRQWWNRRAV